MADPFYPNVDIEVLEEFIMNSGRVVPGGKIQVGDTTTFVLKGNQAIHKRIILIRELEDGQVSYEQATGLAIRLSFIGSLLDWLEVNRNWKEGAYVEQNVERK